MPYKRSCMGMLSAVVMAVCVAGLQPLSGPVVASSGIFTDSGQRLGNSDSRDVALGDLDGDGDLDAFIANAGVGSDTDQPNKVWLNDGNGSFTDSGQSLGNSNSWGVALGDLDGDDDLDAFVANAFSTISLANKVWLNDGHGIFSDSGQSLGGGRSLDVALGDLDGDHDLDALVGNGGINFAWLNDGSGSFQAHCQWIGADASYGVKLGDLDGAGGPDIFIANGSTGANQVWFHVGVSGDPGDGADCDPMFSDSGLRLGGSDSRSVALGDVDLDGDLDAFVANDANQPNCVWQNDGLGIFSDSGQKLGSLATKDIALGDLDGDNDLDAFAANTAHNEAWLNDGAGNFTDSGQKMGSAGSHGVALGDLDGDGDLDAFVANYNNSANTVWLNGGGMSTIWMPMILK